MRIKIKKLLVVFFSLVMILTGILGNGIHSKAATEDLIYITDNTNLVVTPGQTTHVTIPISVKEVFLSITNISVSSTTDKFTFSKPKLSLNGTSVSQLYKDQKTNMDFDVTVDDSLEIKTYPITIKIDYLNNLTLEKDTFSLATSLKVQEEKTPPQLTVGNVTLGSTNIGSSMDLKFTVKNEGEITAKSVYLTMDFGTVMEGNYTATSIKVGDVSTGGTKEISLPVTILSTASVGKNPITVNFKYKSTSGDALTSSYKINVNLTSSVTTPSLSVVDMNYTKGLEPGDNFKLEVVLKNSGTGTASNISANINAASITQDGIIKNYFTDGITLSDVKKSKQGTVKIPLTVSKYATGGMKSVVVDITYTDASGTKYSLSKTVYIDVTAAATATTAPNIVISKVVQSPDQPEAGNNLELSFTVENKSTVDAKELKIFADGLTAATFIPIDSDPYKYIEKLGAGDKVKITIPLSVSTSITEGLNNLTIKYTYTGGEGSAIIPVRNVKNDIGSSSIPKLIVSKYTTDSDELKAGTTFNFIYDIYNTNSTVAAKNITITLTQADNIFTVTQGSNSFFINKIAPGESVENTIEMKVKSDATTKAYPITITIEYEYEGIVPNKETGEVGVKKTETLNLNAEENARPVVDNVNVSSYDGTVMVGGSATISFEFYNMGKAVLNNVIATLEGDSFTSADGSMKFIGNVEAGSSSFVEMNVIPNMEGEASGTVKLSYEDSNGETVEFTKEFTATVMPAATGMDPGIPTDGSGEVFNPDVTIAKEDILPIWAFVLVLLAIFVIFVPLTRKIIIGSYKKKLRKKEEEQY